MTKPLILVVAVVLAIGSFLFARHRYVQRNTTSLGGVVTIHAADQDLFGDWVKKEPVFGIVVPIGLIVAGVVLARKKSAGG